ISVINTEPYHQHVHHKPYQGSSFASQSMLLTIHSIQVESSRRGASVHPVFLGPHDKTLMFAHHHDDWSEGVERQYYVQTYTIPPNSKRSLRWMNVVDSELKLWRKLIREQHPILQHFHDYLKSKTAAGSTRTLVIGQAKELAAHPVDRAKQEKKRQNTYTGTDGRMQVEMEHYCVVRTVVDSKQIHERIKSIMRNFEREGSVQRQDYNFVMSAVMAYLVHCNGARNELTYKTRYGNICGCGDDVPDTGLQAIIDVNFENALEDKAYFCLQVGRYPQPKHHNRVHEPTTTTGGYFVVDKKFKKWIDHYVKLREYALSWAESVMGRRSRAVPTASRQGVESSSESSDESLYDDVVSDYEIDPSAVGEPSQIAGFGSSEVRSRRREKQPAPVAVASRAENIQPPVARGAKTIWRAPAVPSEATAENPSEATAEDIQLVARDIRATTTSSLAMTSPIVMEIEGESTMLERAASALRLHVTGNGQYDGGLGYYQTEYERQCFNLRRLAQPIQDFPWLEIRDIPSISGRGLFAKVPMRKDQVVSDYRGLFITHDERLNMRMDPADETLVGDYEVEYNESSAQLRIPVMIPPRIEVIPSDDSSCSQQMAISHRIAIQRAIDVRNLITSRNVFYSLNVKTRVAGLVPPSGSNMLVSPSDAYRHSRLMFLGSEDHYPISGNDANAPPKANALLQLLCIAYRDAYEMGNPVVLVLKSDGQAARFLRRKRSRTTFVVLLGSMIGAVERKRYGNCIVYEDTGNGCQFVVEQTKERAAEQSMLQQFGGARLMYFPSPVESMWARLRENRRISVEEAFRIMEDFDPHRYLRQSLQELAR
ncbi:hypothetical protein GCK32_008312, partial [Trichostrongylus colubriformis]